ncbi:hypothetical protein ACFFRR_006583 [Megaselia abdita]
MHLQQKYSNTGLLIFEPVNIEASTFAQRSTCLCITGAMRSTSTEALEAILCFKPVYIYIKEIATRSAIRLSCYGFFKETDHGHGFIIEDLANIGWGSDKIYLIMFSNVSVFIFHFSTERSRNSYD